MNARLCAIGALVLSLLAGCAGLLDGGAPRAVAVMGVTVTDLEAVDAGSARQADQTVLVQGGRIVAVGPAATTPVPRDARRSDGRGGFLIPGLWDAHAHTVLAEKPALMTYAALGVTSVRDMGGPYETLRAWRDSISGGPLIGPRLYLSGPVIEGD